MLPNISIIMNFRLIVSAFLVQGLFQNTESAIRVRSYSSCGRYANNTREGKVVGGSDCFEGEFPWMVSFKGEQGHFCGGFVIAEKFVLSAAHCFLTSHGRKKEEEVSTTIGEFSLLTPEKTKDVTIGVAEIILHPGYTTSSREFDIAIVKLKESVHVHPIVEPICLPQLDSPDLEVSSSKVTTAGWGKTSFDQSFYDWTKESDFLKKVEVNLWDTEDCRSLYKSFNNFPSTSFICAGVKGSQSCVGDSGGPLMHLEGARWTAIGIVSVGQECGAKGRPSVYTDLQDYVPWIRTVILPQ